MRQQSLAIVGADHPNKRGPARRFGIALCSPGDPIVLIREPKNEHDEYAIAVYGHDVQLGYVSSERAAWIAPMLDQGREIVAIFQEAADYGCAIRVAFDGDSPTLPSPIAKPEPPAEGADNNSGFYPDEDYDC